MTLGPALFLLVAGAAAGLLGSLLGLGGGILIVPVLVLLLKVPMHNAIATSLLCVIATSSAAASKNVSSGLANVRLGMSLEISTVLGALIGSALAGMLSERTLMIIFACAMLVMSIPMARGVDDLAAEESEGESEERTGFAAALDGSYYDAAEKRQVNYRVQKFPAAMGISSIAGILSGLLGVGGGIIKVPALTILCNMPMKAAAATSNFMIGVTAVASAVIYYGRGDILPLISAASVLGVFAGSRAGVHVASRVKSVSLRRVFALVMIIVAVEFIFKARGMSLR
jgi:uncharacterized membrane protein YfcA